MGKPIRRGIRTFPEIRLTIDRKSIKHHWKIDGKSIKIEPKIHAVFHQKTGCLKIFKKLALEASRASFWRALGTSWAPWGRSWAPVGRFLGAFWTLLGVLLGVLGASWALKARFGSILEGSWGGLGVIWEPLGGLWAPIFAQNALITAGTSCWHSPGLFVPPCSAAVRA